MPTVPPRDLAAFAAGLFTAHGAPNDIATVVAAALVDADLAGHDSHGVAKIPDYLDKIRDGRLDPAARPEVSERRGAVGSIDARRGFGQPAGRAAAALVCDLATDSGVACVSVRNTNHMGRLGAYAEAIAARGLASMIVSGGAARGGAVAPFGGRDRVFGTNPFAIGLPAGDASPLLVDFATSATAEGKLALAIARGEKIPAGLLLDEEGRGSRDPASFYRGGALLPFGAHKGYGLMFAAEILANVLAGAAPVSSDDYRPGNPTLMTAWQIDAFCPRADYERHVEQLIDTVRRSRPAAGHDRVRVPGEPETEARARRDLHGIPLPTATWNDLSARAAAAGVPLPAPLAD